ncbi:hypothetical protein BC351_25075 [Paenibacillus ferrarius]|uniref:Uncharacterized protein n=1 Tax=Paenibacillus ferrarius TaxID=1469647 RepID=A0A1V4HJL1_9BACL|nr:hypothetical protein BC351_25075 [Paenibacillus ferrarius]
MGGFSLPSGIFPAIVHPFRLGNEQKSEKPAIMHPLASFSQFQGGKAEKACTFAGFLCFHTI